jgi:two-component system, NtrC family, sensor histidine kinase PilS
MTPSAYTFLGLTGVVAALIAVLVFAVLRFAAAARESRQHLRESGSESGFMAAALQEALAKLKAQEREMFARAEASERLSGEIVESLTAGLLVVDIGGDVRILNPAARRMLGLGEAATGVPYRTILGAISPLADVIEAGLASGRPIVRRKLELTAARSGVSHLGVTVSPLSDGRGSRHGVICLFTDLTPVVDMEEQLRLQDGLARVGELTAGIAHEFRNGLATIHGYARLIDLDTLPPACRSYVEGIRQETEALGQVVTNFLTFAKPAQLTLAPVDLRAIADRAAEEFRGEARIHGGAVTVQGEFPTIQGDEVLLRQAFSNLVRNAVEACVDASVAPGVSVDGQIDASQGVARISIADNGPGIEAADRERIFRPFFTTKGRGTGLGLALVQKIIVSHNGRISVGVAPGGGANLQVILPLATASERPEVLPSVTN